MLNCLVCIKPLTGLQKKYCCVSCKMKSSNIRNQAYKGQRIRGEKNKLKLLNMTGCKCSKCGYNKNYSALCFHHLHDKKFPIDLRHCSNTKFDTLLEESKKCIVLCHNCHMETHYPENTIGGPPVN